MKNGIWSFYKLLMKKQLYLCNTLAQENQGLNEEFKHYLSQAVVHLKYDPVLNWQEQKNLLRTKELHLSSRSPNRHDVYEYRWIIRSL